MSHLFSQLRPASSAFADQPRGAVSVLTINGPVDSDAVSQLARRVSQALADDPRLVVDLLAVPAMNPQIPSELSAALRNASTATARLAIITADRRLHHALKLSGIDGLELYESITAALAVAHPSPAVPHELTGVGPPDGSKRYQNG